jgi:FixJ family two-component response regulator
MTSVVATQADPLIVVVDDDIVVRESIGELLQSVGIDAIGFGSTREVLHAELPERPGCIVLDVRMPGLSGLDLQQHLAASGNSKPVIFLTGHGDIPMTVQAMKAGALDFLTKPFRDQQLLDAVAAGIERDIERQANARIVKASTERHASLTPREREVLREVVRGRLNKQIAFDLGISEVTVKLHRSSVMKKMAARTAGELIRAWDMLPAELRGAG